MKLPASRPDRRARPWRHAAASICAGLLVACAGSDGQRDNRVALVIGNGGYDQVPALRNPTNDAADMCAALRRLGFRALCHTDLRSRAEFDAAIQDYVALLTPQSVGLVYYSGHGVQVGNANYLIPTQAQLVTASDDPLPVLYGVDTLFGRLRQRPTRLQFVILDACRNELFDTSPRRIAGRGASAAGAGSLMRALGSLPQAAAGLAPIKDAPPGTLVLYATAAREAAFDGVGRNGPLTKQVLANIETRGLPLMDFVGRVIQGVESETQRGYHKRQTPYIYGSFSGRFCFAGCPGETDVPPMY
jgi:uncharacterized caspase-like protein